MDLFNRIREIFNDEKIKIVRLEPGYQFKPFDCGVKELNDFLLEDSITHLEHLENVTYLMETEAETISYWTLSNDRLLIRDIEDFRSELNAVYINDSHYSDSFFEQCDYPAVKLSFLAVSSKYQGKGIGKIIIDYLKINFIKDNKTGCQFITINALHNNETIRFYEREGFALLTNEDIDKKWRAMYCCLLIYTD